MEWTDKHSVKLTTACIAVLAIMVAGTMIFMQEFIQAIVPVEAAAPEHRHWFLVSLELCLGVGLLLLFLLYRLIKNIDNDQTFTEKNIQLLRYISWLCFLETAILAVSASYYFPWIFVAGVTGFVGVITRIIKNVFCQAHLLKEENDYTI